MKGAVPIHVAFRGVQKSYGGGHLAVRNLDLDIRHGEFLTLLGPSGSGKTTALMMLAGFEAPTAGEILIDGKRIDRVPANRRSIGLVFQNYALFPHMSVAENLAYPLKVRRLGKAEVADRVTRMLDLVQLPGLGHRHPAELSGGQQQRVAVARALIFEPALVLMDEPLGALDKQLREQMQFEIKAIHDRLGVTFLYVTHDQTEALTMSDRIAVFDQGQIGQIATPAELYERPATNFVAGFIGENNRLSGRVISGCKDGLVTVELQSGTTIGATCLPGLQLATPVTLSVRPERARIIGMGDTMPVSLPATVRQTIYVGDHLRVVLDLAECPGFIVKIPNAAGLPDLSPGTSVKVGWRVEDGRALAQ